MLRVVAGDEAAFEEVVRRYWGSLVAYATRVLDDGDGGRDVAQESLVRVWEHRRAWRPGPLKSYLFTIARSLVIDELRRRRVQALFGSRPWLTRDGEWSAPSEQSDHDQLSSAIDAAIQALPVRCREVFTLTYLRGVQLHRSTGTSGHYAVVTVAPTTRRRGRGPYDAGNGVWTARASSPPVRPLDVSRTKRFGGRLGRGRPR